MIRRLLRLLRLLRLRVPRQSREAGSATAELALALPTLVLVLTLGVWMQSAVALHARCLDVARAGAPAVARGDPDAQVRGALSADLPAGASVAIGHGGGQVTVTVRAQLRAPAGLATLVSAPMVAASASGPDEADIRPQTP